MLLKVLNSDAKARGCSPLKVTQAVLPFFSLKPIGRRAYWKTGNKYIYACSLTLCTKGVGPNFCVINCLKHMESKDVRKIAKVFINES